MNYFVHDLLQSANISQSNISLGELEVLTDAYPGFCIGALWTGLPPQ